MALDPVWSDVRAWLWLGILEKGKEEKKPVLPAEVVQLVQGEGGKEGCVA